MSDLLFHDVDLMYQTVIVSDFITIISQQGFNC